MRHARSLLPPVALALCSLAPLAAAASYPAGVWGLVEKVDVMKPGQVRIDGVFMVANQQPDFAMYPGYSVPAYGFMIYECPAGQEATCAMEWADLTAAAGSENKCRGWGDSSFKDNGTVRAWDEPQANPDVWPISMGVVTGFSPCDALKGWIESNPPPPMTDTTGGAETSGGMTDGTGSPGTSGEATTGRPETGGPQTSGGSETGATGGTGGGESGGGGETGATGGGEAGGGETGSGETGGGETGAATGGDSSGKDDGCGCRSDGSGGLGALGLGLGLVGLRRRRGAMGLGASGSARWR